MDLRFAPPEEETAYRESPSKSSYTDYLQRNYFFWASISLLILSVVAFSDNLFFDVTQKSNSDPKFVIHGLFFLAWFIMLVIQTYHIRKRNYKAHMVLGIAGMVIAVGVVVSTFYVFIAVYKGWDQMSFIVKSNRIFTICFAILTYLAYRYRKDGVKHKRFLLMGTLYVLTPVLDRVAGKLDIDSFMSVELFNQLIWHVFFVSLFFYDWRTLKRIHPISWMGVVWFYVVWMISIAISE